MATPANFATYQAAKRLFVKQHYMVLSGAKPKFGGNDGVRGRALNHDFKELVMVFEKARETFSYSSKTSNKTIYKILIYELNKINQQFNDTPNLHTLNDQLLPGGSTI